MLFALLFKIEKMPVTPLLYLNRLLALFIYALGQALQDGVDADNGTLYLNRLLRQSAGDIMVQPVTTIERVSLSYPGTLRGKVSG